ncbi:MAG TPA: hypothetical protein VEA59_02570 [Patescibacteria group bacterium]|nr:hypothetical protein [Patescibacteria group bacterium]
MKKVLTAAAALATMITFSGVASAAGIWVDDSSSLNHNTNLNLLLQMLNRNNSTTSNSLNGVASSGSNFITVADDAENTDISSGVSDSAVGADVQANEIQVDALIETSGPSGTGSATAVNITDDSSANVNENDNITHFIDNDNTNSIGNSLNTTSSSGSNGAAIGDGSLNTRITSGDARTTTLFTGMFDAIAQLITVRRNR